jgi:putative endonuclease
LNTRQAGRIGEQTSAEFLRNAGWRIVETNFQTRRGEIDIVAEREQILSFVEVKSWNYHGVEELEYSVDSKKRRTIIRCAETYLAAHPEFADHSIRFDVMFNRPGDGVQRHLQNAFTESSERW